MTIKYEYHVSQQWGFKEELQNVNIVLIWQ